MSLVTGRLLWFVPSQRWAPCRFADVCHPFVVSSLPKARNEPATMVPLTEVITASSGDGKHDEGHHHKITLQLAVTMMVKQIKCVYAASLEKCA